MVLRVVWRTWREEKWKRKGVQGLGVADRGAGGRGGVVKGVEVVKERRL